MKGKLIEKYCYISYPAITIILTMILCYFLNKYNLSITLAEDFSSNIVQISGSLIGFLLTAITIFLSLSKNNKVMYRVKKYKHHIIFSRCIFCGVCFLILSIFFWAFNMSERFVLIAFLLGLEETVISAYYIYKLCIYDFEQLVPQGNHDAI